MDMMTKIISEVEFFIKKLNISLSFTGFKNPIFDSVDSVYIYNEYSLQHELGIYLRKVFPTYRVEFERNASFFIGNEQSVKLVKHEIDIVIYDDKVKYAIELKFPINGEYPVTMYNCLKDIRFCEQLTECGFNGAISLTVSADKLYFMRTSRCRKNDKYEQLYNLFRGKVIANETMIVPFKGIIKYYQREKNNELEFSKEHSILWKNQEGKILTDSDRKALNSTKCGNTCPLHYYLVDVRI